MTFGLLAAAYTFTAVATGVGKGTAVEFMFAGPETDRDYETMFVLEKSVGEICRDLEKAGLARGLPTDLLSCDLWPAGVAVTLSPAITNFVDITATEGLSFGPVIYTGGTRTEKGGAVVASEEMPRALFSFYTLSQSPFLYDGVYNQGDVYGTHQAKATLKKGERHTFTLTWDERARIERMTAQFTRENVTNVFHEIRRRADKGSVVVRAEFDPSLTLGEAQSIAAALSILDSSRVKMNGRADGQFFFRAYLPLEKWRDRTERLTQPFELTLTDKDERLVFIDEDWSGEGVDPVLTPKTIPFAESFQHPKTDTCFIYAGKTTTLGRLYSQIARLPKSVCNWYVFDL